MPTASAGPVTKVGSNFEFTVTHDALPEAFTVVGAIVNGVGQEAPFSTPALFPVTSRIDDGGGRMWTPTVVDSTHTKFTAPV